ncbi:MAG TPA: NAD-glutamate dehydrogenase [Geodermatophilus sp.]|nr:NAD-glutamate dehydrogenase [Geodermatophilus sp.]
MSEFTAHAETSPTAAAAPWWRHLPGALRASTGAERLLGDYFATSASDDLADRSVDDLRAAVASHVTAGARRRRGEAVVRAVDGVVSGAGEQRTTVEVVAEDMVFLVESVTAALTRLGRGIHMVVHPRFAARRDPSGVLLDLGPAESATPEDVVEAWIRVEVERKAEPGARQALVTELGSVLDDVHAAVRDWQPMRAKALEAADELDSCVPPGVPEEELRSAAHLLRWLADDRFTFLGYREYELQAGDGDARLVPRPGTSLGLLAGERERPAGAARLLTAAVPGQAGRRVLRVTKANERATVHRSAYLDTLTVPTYDRAGHVTGERRLLGLFTSGAYSESVRRVPVVAEKVAEVLRRAGFASGTHSARDLLSILEFFPRDELLQADVEEILPTALAVLRLQERRRTRLFLRHDALGGFLSCLVFLPKDRYSTTVGNKVEELLRQALNGATAETALHMSESALARLHVVVRPRPDETLRDVEIEELEAVVAKAVRSWEDDVLDAARERLGAAEGTGLVRRWVRGVPGAYRADVSPVLAVEDLLRAEALLAADDSTVAENRETGHDSAPVEPAPMLALREASDLEPRTWRLSLYRLSPATLSEVLPVLADLGVEVTDERPHLLERADGRRVWVYDIGLRVPQEFWRQDSDAEATRARFRNAFAAARTGRAESDALSQLVLAAQLSWQQVAVLRALVRYLRQTGLPYTLDYVAGTLLAETAVTNLLVRLFEARLDPERHGRPEERAPAVHAVLDELRSALDAVEGLDADRILRALLSAVQAVLRTNAFQHRADGNPPEHLSFKLDPSQVAGMPDPKPKYEIWVYSPRVEGVHLRFGDVARGGLRWSDRREDFRTEVLGLVKAQIVKNAVIVPTGAKGGFVAKRLPDPAVDRDAWWAEGVACYRTFISGLLDVSDNLRIDGERQVVVPPAGVVRYDGDDPYLVVAADKGTASFSDLANAIAQQRGFWLGDAFASGGSNGYDHKAMGITARGAWESVRRHFRELGVDPQTTDITVVGVGDMSGDVFGNGMLLSEHIRLVAAFDHRHVFLDPDPDPGVSFRERARLFALPRSSWADYDPALLSPGGGVYPRTAKSVPISPQVAERLGLAGDTTALSPDELVRAVLRAPVDLFWNGGIGTYVKASTEQHAEVGDKANDAVRVDGTDLRVRVVGEGGNLGLTQLGRIEAARQGVRLNTDAVDNSAGVDCSDHEVNIKIMLDRLVADGSLGEDERNSTLRRMTEEVARLVLRNNYQQNRVLSVEGVGAADMLPAHRRFIEALEATGTIDRRLEALPSSAELDRRAREGAGLTVPELSVLLAYAKISLGAAVLASDLPDEGWMQGALRAYFPTELRKGFTEHLAEHPLRRDIATTVLVNEVVDTGGVTFPFRAAEETGRELAEVVRAYAVASQVFDLEERSAAVEALDGQVPAHVQALLRQQHQRLLDRAVRWLLHARPEGIDVPAEVDRFAPAMRDLAARVPDLLVGQDLRYVQELADQFTAAGVEVREALTTASLLFVYPLLDVVEIAEATGRLAGEVATTWFVLSERYGIDALLTKVSALNRTDRWEALARAALRDDLYGVLRAFTTAVLTHAATAPPSASPPDANSAVAAWEAMHASAVQRARQTLTDLDSAGRADLAALSVALRRLRAVLPRR